MDKAGSAWYIDIKNALLEEEDMNVVMVDWQQGAKGPNYFQATVGSIMALLIQDMHTVARANFGHFHLIGISLGAHIAGIAGKEVFRLTNQKVGRVTGFDPAGPNFENYSNRVRIDSTDAQFVGIIHSDAEPLLKAGLGIRAAVGHVDFYPNGGVNQPGCPANKFGIQALITFAEQMRFACSHIRAVYYFTNSIQRCRYNPPDGNTTCTMGYHVSSSCRGDIRPTTTGTAPFC